MSGRLYVGGGAYRNSSAGAFAYQLTYTELPFTAASPFLDTPPAARNLYFGASVITPSPAQQDTTKCAGSASSPAPQPGILCVYVADAVNVEDANMQVYAGALPGQADPADRNGFHVYGRSVDANVFSYNYIWAYRAP